MIVDTSAWIEYLKATGSSAHRTLRAAIRDGEPTIVSPDIVLAEIVAGARDDHHANRLTRLLFTFRVEPLSAHDDALEAARIYRHCRAQGVTVRSISDCLIAAVAIRLDEPVLAIDRDFAKIAAHSGLRLAQ